MSKITIRPTVHFAMTLEVNEIEARALHVLTEYGTEKFLQFFYAQLGSHYLKPHEQGLRALFENIKAEVGPALNKTDRVRNKLEAAFEEARK